MNNQRPLVSIIVPVYNAQDHIRDCVQSLLDQTYPNKEIILVDDGSTDDSKDIISEFGEAVTYILQENAGSAVARNRGIDESKGDYIAFNDSDDLWAPNRLQQQVDFLETHPEYGVVTGRFQHVSEDFPLDQTKAVDDSIPPKVVAKRSGWVYHTLFECSWYHIIAALVRAEDAKAVKYDPDFRRGQDFDFWVRLSHRTQVAQLDVNYAYYRKNFQSISHRPHLRNYRAEIMDAAIEKLGPASPDGQTVSQADLNKFFYNTWFEHGYELFLAEMYRPALRSFKTALKYQPLKLGSYKFIVRCLLKITRSN